MNDVTYSRFIAGVRKSGLVLDRKILADLAVHDPNAFSKIATMAKGE